MNNENAAELAAALVGGTPMAFKAYPDGSLVVIGPSGKKFRFTPQQVEKAQARLVVLAAPKQTSLATRTKKTTSKQTTSITKPPAKPASTKASPKPRTGEE